MKIDKKAFNAIKFVATAITISEALSDYFAPDYEQKLTPIFNNNNMKKHEITAEQIWQLSKAENQQQIKADLKQWFPDIFLQVGKWYASSYGTFFCFQGKFTTNASSSGQSDAFGFGFDGIYYETGMAVYEGEIYRLMDEFEVFRLIKSQAVKLGIIDEYTSCILGNESSRMAVCNTGGVIFENGKFINEPKYKIGQWVSGVGESMFKIEFISENGKFAKGHGILKDGSLSKFYNIEWYLAGCNILSDSEVKERLLTFARKHYKEGEKIVSTKGDACRISKGITTNPHTKKDLSLYTQDGYSQIFNAETMEWADKVVSI